MLIKASKNTLASLFNHNAIKARASEFDSLSEDKKCLAIRNELKEHNKSLAEAAQNAVVETPFDIMLYIKITDIKVYMVV